MDKGYAQSEPNTAAKSINKPQEFILEAFADPTSVRDVVRGILHAIFFHRYFPTLTAQTHEVLDLTLPYVAVPELETLIDQRTASLVRELDSDSASHNAPAQQYSLPQQGRATLGAVVGGLLGAGSAPTGGGGGAGAGSGGRGQVTVQFMEKTRRKKMWYKGDEEILWETWTVRVTVAEPRTESGEFVDDYTYVRVCFGDAQQLIHCRTSQSPKSNGVHTPHGRHENHHVCQHTQRAYPAHLDNRNEPLPVLDHSQPKQ